jgi:hypothetical protein
MTVVHAERHVPVLPHTYGAQSWVVPSAFRARWSPSQAARGPHSCFARSHVLPAGQSLSALHAHEVALQNMLHGMGAGSVHMP